jgi:hypothetical protein
VKVVVIAIVTVNTFGIGTAEVLTKRLLSGRTVTTTTTVVRLLSTAISSECETQAAFLRGGRLCFVVAKESLWSDRISFVAADRLQKNRFNSSRRWEKKSARSGAS